MFFPFGGNLDKYAMDTKSIHHLFPNHTFGQAHYCFIRNSCTAWEEKYGTEIGYLMILNNKWSVVRDSCITGTQTQSVSVPLQWIHSQVFTMTTEFADLCPAGCTERHWTEHHQYAGNEYHLLELEMAILRSWYQQFTYAQGVCQVMKASVTTPLKWIPPVASTTRSGRLTTVPMVVVPAMPSSTKNGEVQTRIYKALLRLRGTSEHHLQSRECFPCWLGRWLSLSSLIMTFKKPLKSGKVFFAVGLIVPFFAELFTWISMHQPVAFGAILGLLTFPGLFTLPMTILIFKCWYFTDACVDILLILWTFAGGWWLRKNSLLVHRLVNAWAHVFHHSFWIRLFWRTLWGCYLWFLNNFFRVTKLRYKLSTVIWKKICSWICDVHLGRSVALVTFWLNTTWPKSCIYKLFCMNWHWRSGSMVLALLEKSIITSKLGLLASTTWGWGTGRRRDYTTGGWLTHLCQLRNRPLRLPTDCVHLYDYK